MILISWSSPVYDTDWKFQSSPPIPPLLKLKFASLHLQRLQIDLLLNLLVCFISLWLTSIRSQEFVVLSMQFSYLAYNIHLVLKSPLKHLALPTLNHTMRLNICANMNLDGLFINQWGEGGGRFGPCLVWEG